MKKSDLTYFLAIQDKMLKILDERDELEKSGYSDGANKKERQYKRLLNESIAFYDKCQAEEIFEVK